MQLSSVYFDDTHRLLRDTLRRFVQKEVVPRGDTWEEQGFVPREVLREMGRCGFLGLRYPEKYHGGGMNALATALLAEELRRVGAEIKRHAEELLGIQDVQNFLDAMEEQGFSALVKTVVPKLVSVQRLTDILRRLIREEISIKNMKAILEALAEWAPHETDPVYLTEYVRMNMKRYIAHKFGGGQPVLPVYLLDPVIEQAIRGGIRHAASGARLSLEPDASQGIMESFRKAFARVDMSATRPIVPGMPGEYTANAAAWRRTAPRSIQRVPLTVQSPPVFLTLKVGSFSVKS